MIKIQVYSFKLTNYFCLVERCMTITVMTFVTNPNITMNNRIKPKMVISSEPKGSLKKQTLALQRKVRFT